MDALLEVAGRIHTYTDDLDASKQVPVLLRTLVLLMDSGTGVTADYGVKALFNLTTPDRYFAEYEQQANEAQADYEGAYIRAVKAAHVLTATIINAGVLGPLASCTWYSDPPELAETARTVLENLDHWVKQDGGIAVLVS